MNIKIIENTLLSKSEKDKIEGLQRFFKTGKGEYAEDDKFLGITVPNVREVVKRFYKDINFNEIEHFISSEYHEFRLFALLVIIEKYNKTKIFDEKQKIIDFYFNNLKYVNNWDLVDLSCYKLYGDFLYNFNLDRKILYDFSKSNNLWIRRISIISTMYFVKKSDFTDALNISKFLIKDNEDLIQKAIGWILREIGKKDINILKQFLLDNINDIQSITFSYATEKLSQEEKIYYKNIKKNIKNKLTY